MRERSREKSRIVAHLHQLNHWLDGILTKKSVELVLDDLQEIQAQLPSKMSLCKLQRQDRQKLIILVKQTRKSSDPKIAEPSSTSGSPKHSELVVVHQGRSTL